MKKSLFLAVFLIAATFSWAETWNAALIEDQFGQKTRDTVFYQLVDGISYVAGRPSYQIVGLGYYSENNATLPDTVAFYLNGYSFFPHFIHNSRSRVALSVKDALGNVRVYGGWQKVDASGISVIMDKGSDLPKLLELPYMYLAVLEGNGWSARFDFTGGLPRRR